MSELPLAAIDRIIRKAGADRVSEDAVEELGKVLEEQGIRIAQQARVYAEHAKRKTITGEDVRLALKESK